MKALEALLCLISWYESRAERKANNIKALIKKFILEIQSISKEIEKVLADRNTEPIEIDILYNMLFNSEEESDLIFAINEFLNTLEAMKLFNEQEINEIVSILNEFKINIALVANVYNNLKSGGKRDYISIQDLWRDSEE